MTKFARRISFPSLFQYVRYSRTRHEIVCTVGDGWHPFLHIDEFNSCPGACGGLAVFLLQWQLGSSKPEIHPNIPPPPIQCLTVP